MSRSRKKAIMKDHGHQKAEYWKVHRRVNKSVLTHHCSINFHDDHWEEPTLKRARELVNDYNYADWIWNAEYKWYNFPDKEKWRRK